MKVVDFVQVEKLIPIYKEGSEANAIQVARVKDSEGNSCEFNVIVGKGLYNVGDNVIYIQPDHCLPDNYIFTEYFRPGGDEKKCKLGKKGRIRAIKFNFQFDGKSDPIYSNGIIIPIDLALKSETIEAINNGTIAEDFDLQKELQIIKYEADDNTQGGSSGLTKGELPGFLYATDETRIENLKSHVLKVYEAGEIVSITRKVDGSSTTEFFKINPATKEEQKGICSRNQEKKLEQRYTHGYTQGDAIIHQYTKMFEDSSKINGWMNDITGTFYTDAEVKDLGLEEVIREIRDAWVDTDKKYGYLDKLEEYCKLHNVQLALRGELHGTGTSKGGGNKLNSDAKVEGKVVWFGVDDLSSGFSTRINYSQEHNLQKVCTDLGLEYTEELYSGVMSYDDIIKFGDEYFKRMVTEKGIYVEGIVIQTKFSNNLSTKYLSSEYDAKK